MSNLATAGTPAAPLPAESLIQQIRDEILARQHFLITSHARPDGDSIGSQLAMAFALDALGKQSRIINADRAPDHYYEFPGMERIEIAADVPADATADTTKRAVDAAAETGERVRDSASESLARASEQAADAASSAKDAAEQARDVVVETAGTTRDRAADAAAAPRHRDQP